MDVTLYVYDLSRGLARQLSQQLLGTYIDAVYHTSLVFNNREYFFGQGVQICLPGSTHHGQPMQQIVLGKTQLPMDTVLEYLESLRAIYTPESYDLFLHNCNNFSNDFAMFLVGKGIPDNITSLPQTVLNTPFGQMLKPQLDQAIRGIAQVPVAPPPRASISNSQTPHRKSLVHTPTSTTAFNEIFARAQNSCAVLFFTSPTCPPCKMCYEPFERMAAEYEGKAEMVKVDISKAREISELYSIRATPTFITFCRGEKVEQWSGADVARLEGSTRILVEMANPPHPHTKLNLPLLQKRCSPAVYGRIPPLEKVTAKLEPDIQSRSEVKALTAFITARTKSANLADVMLPNLTDISVLVRSTVSQRQPDKMFPLIDLIRLALIDTRVSGFFAEEQHPQSVFHFLIKYCSSFNIIDGKSYPFLLTSIQALSNAFTSPLSAACISASSYLHQLISNCLLDNDHPALRASTATLIYNLANAHHQEVVQAAAGHPATIQGEFLVELLICLLEGLKQEIERKTQAQAEMVKNLILSTGFLLYGATIDTIQDLKDTLDAIDAKKTIRNVRKISDLDSLANEVLQIIP